MWASSEHRYSANQANNLKLKVCNSFLYFPVALPALCLHCTQSEISQIMFAYVPPLHVIILWSHRGFRI